jgi:hypothetical protein
MHWTLEQGKENKAKGTIMGTGAPAVFKLQLLIDIINFQKSSRDGRRLDL